MEQQKLNFSLNSKARNVMLYTFLEEEYTKVHNLRSAKQIWDTLVVTYEVTSQVKRNKLSLLTYKYDFFPSKKTKTYIVYSDIFKTFLMN